MEHKDNRRLETTILRKIWFINIVLLFIWVVILFVDIYPDIEISNELLKTVLYGLAGFIPMYFIYEAIGLWKHYHITIKDPTQKSGKEKDQ